MRMDISGLFQEQMISYYLLVIFICGYVCVDCLLVVWSELFAHLYKFLPYVLFPSYRIGPFEVESALIEHPAVAESAVVSSPDPIRGEVTDLSLP